MKRLSTIALCLCLIALGAAKEPEHWLPASFNGWQMAKATAKSGTDPKWLDAADAPVLAEYGLSDFESAEYRRNGRTMTVKAARFKDVSGSFGAFTFYLQPGMASEDIGDKGASSNSRVLFYRGNFLVDVSLEKVTAMSAADLRALANALPQLHGETAVLPNLPGEIPKQSLIANTAHYIEGPLALERLGVPIPADLVDFSKTRDVEFARYRTRNGEASLTLVDYSTPQLAAERLRAWQAAPLPGGPFYFRHSGPLLAAMNGNLPESEAQDLLSQIYYDADVTVTQPTRPGRNENRYGFIVALVTLVVVVLVVALLIGLTFGGLRVWLRKSLNRGRPGATDDVEIIRLNLK
jgi:hypothetical protein